MHIKILNITKDKNKRLWLLILTALTVAAILIFITISFLFHTDGTNNISTSNNFSDFFNLKSYKYGCNATIISNKTRNTYYFEEEYLNKNQKESFHFKMKNDNDYEIDYIIENNNLHIKSNKEINEYTLSNYVVKKTNLLSISTFISIYNDVNSYIKENENNDDIKIEIEESSDSIIYSVILNNYNLEVLNKYKDILNDGISVKKLQLIFSKKENKPIKYLVFDNNDLAYIDINYSFFDINNNFK